MADDDDEVALDEGMEPESPTGEDPGDGDDDYDDGDGDHVDVAAGGPVSRTVSTPRGTRPVSDKVRELMKAAGAKMKEQGALDEEEPLDHEDLPQEPDPADKRSAQVAPPAGTPNVASPPAGDPAAAPPPAPSLDPEVVRLREEWTGKARELEAREAKLAEAEATGDLGQLRDVYFERGAPAVLEVIKKWVGSVSDDELKDEVADLITELSQNVLGVEVPQEVRDRLEVKRAKKGIKALKDATARERAAAERQAKEAAEAQDRVRVIGILSQEIVKPEHAQTYPFLAVEDDPGQLIWDTFEAQRKKDGTELHWQECAKRINAYLKQQNETHYGKRSHLLSAANGQRAGAQAAAVQRTQGNPSQVTGSAPPPKQPAPAPQPKQDPTKWDPEAHRKAVKAKHAQRIRQAFADEE